MVVKVSRRSAEAVAKIASQMMHSAAARCCPTCWQESQVGWLRELRLRSCKRSCQRGEQAAEPPCSSGTSARAAKKDTEKL